MAAIDRAGILTQLNWRYAPLLSAAGIVGTDTSAGLGPALDATQGVVDAQETAPSAGLTTLIARYLTLEVICDRLAAAFDVATGGDSYRLSQRYADAQKQFSALTEQVGWLVLGETAGASAGQIVTVTAPYLNDPWGTGDEFGARTW